MSEIRSMESRDITAVRELMIQLAEDLGHDFQMDHEQCIALYQKMLRHENIYQNFVYCKEHVVVGFLSMVLYHTWLHGGGTALINELVVERSNRGRNIGSALVAHAKIVAESRGLDEIEVGVMQDNGKALSFYRKHGFDEEYMLLGAEFS